VAPFANYEPPARRQKLGRGWIGWLLIAFVAIAVAGVAIVPSPYVVEQPGPVFDTLGTVTSNGETVPLIDIPMKETFATTGSLDLLTVTLSGNRESPLNWFQVALASLDPSEAVIPVDEAFPKGQTIEQSNKEGQLEMQTSQREAIAAALRYLDYDFPSTVQVEDIDPGSPADGKILAKDVIESVDGVAVADVSELRARIKANGTDKAVQLKVLRDGAEQTIEITPTKSAGADPAPVIGVLVSGQYDFPFEVTIQLDNVGGPSAGQMFALGIIDKLTKGSLNGGKDVAGTGTIDADGTVGAIGGIRQKMWGAVRAGARYFLAPVANCDEVSGHIPDGLTVIPVKTLKDSIAALSAISNGTKASQLPQCPSS
jgi:Lon-like protease